MRYLGLMMVLLFVTGCVYRDKGVCPDHVSINPSIDWEIQRGEHSKMNTGVEMCLDWTM